MKNHRFKSIRKGGKKGARRNQTKKVRVGAKAPGGTLGAGTIRRPL